MKLCVPSSTYGCPIPIASCSNCWDSSVQADCDCDNEDYPDNWGKRTCADGEEPDTSGTTDTDSGSVTIDGESSSKWTVTDENVELIQGWLD